MTECTRTKGVPKLAGCHCYDANQFGYMGYVWVYSRLVRVRWGTIGKVPNVSGNLPMDLGSWRVKYYTECGQGSWILTQVFIHYFNYYLFL